MYFKKRPVSLNYLVFVARFEIGVGVFIGWAGSTLLVVGGLIYSIFAGKDGCQSRYSVASAIVFFWHLHVKIYLHMNELLKTNYFFTTTAAQKGMQPTSLLPTTQSLPPRRASRHRLAQTSAAVRSRGAAAAAAAAAAAESAASLASPPPQRQRHHQPLNTFDLFVEGAKCSAVNIDVV